MANLEPLKSHGKMEITSKRIEMLSYGKERLKHHTKCFAAKEADDELSKSVQDVVASCTGRTEGKSCIGDIVGARLSTMNISHGTELLSQNMSTRPHTKMSEKLPKTPNLNNNTIFPAPTDDSRPIKMSTSEDEVFLSNNTLELQGLRRRVTVKELIEADLLNKNVAEQLDKGIKTVSQVQMSLGKYLNQANSIAGLYLESSKQKISFNEAVKEGIIESSVALEFLEAQAATGFLVDTLSHGKYSVQEAVDKGLVATEFKEALLQAEKAVTGYLYNGKTLSVFQAMESKLVTRQVGTRLLEVQIATGGIVDPGRSVRLPLETACKQGHLSHEVARTLNKTLGKVRGFENPNTRQGVHYAELMKLCVVDLAGNHLLLPFGTRKISTPSPDTPSTISVVDTNTKSEITLYDAFLKYYIEKQIYLERSEVQSQWRETTDKSEGGTRYFLTDVNSGRMFSIDDALTQGKISQVDLNKYRDGRITVTELADMLTSRSTVAPNPNSPIAGIWDPNECRRISVLKAMHQNLLDRLTATRLLEAQACTGGIINPPTGKRYSISDALQYELMDTEIAASIQKSQQAYSGFQQPGSQLALSTYEALRRNLVGRDLGHRFLELQHLTGGLVDPNLQTRMPLEDARSNGLVDDQTARRLQDEKMHARNLVCPKTKEKISYKEALARAVFDCHTGMRFLEAAVRSDTLK
ncbi:plectin-like [Amblyraja radiata]|uniref:plectin-like n=1 Tax=Amblyraja radiata TaxID=386614 RepID=UPI0014020232|nr:plectin-like [Amblyraja radiata]